MNSKGPTPPPSGGVGPHESTLGDFPPMDSAPPSGNLNFNLLPPPPPPPKMRRPLSPPRSASQSGGSSASSSGNAPLPPPPKIPAPPPPPPRSGGVPPPPADKPAPKAVPSPPEEPIKVKREPSPSPPRLPLTTFAPKGADVNKVGMHILARRQTHIPILVISTESTQQLAFKNNLRLNDMFQGIVHDLKFSSGSGSGNSNNSLPPFRSISKSLFPTQLPVQFVEPSQLEPDSYQAAHDLLQEHAKLQDADGNVAQELVLLEDRVEELLQDPTQSEQAEELEQTTKDAYQLTSPLDIPWLIRYRLALDDSTDALPHDLTNCPSLILLVCTTQEVESPEEVLTELYNAPHILPTAFKNGLYDPHTVRHEVLVLHDNVDGPRSLDDVGLRSRLQSQFGPNAAVLRINNVLPETAQFLSEQEDTDLWGGGGKKGNSLSVNDRVLLRRYFQTILTSSLLPALERRVATLNTIVSDRKKGMRNLVKSFWRKPKEDTPAPPPTNANSGDHSSGNPLHSEVEVKYRYDSIESQTRLLADTLFLMQDYEAALSTYRLIRDDYKSDKALCHYANVQEMMALCMHYIDPFVRAKEIFSHLETALLSYTRAAEEERIKMKGRDPSSRPTTAPHATRLATRLCLLLATMPSDSMTHGRELEVADLLASASSHESSLGAAVLLEQASSFYYQAGMFRKYAFHMLMSGHMFRTAGQDQHAFRCFTSALYVYRHGQWAELHNHLRSALAAQLFTMGRMSVALTLYAKLVAGAGKVSSKSQQKFLTHLLEICRDHPKKALAGADRMAAPPNLRSAREREAFRNARLDRIVSVIRYTMGSSRVLELPYMKLPLVVDKSVRIWTHAEQHFIQHSNGKDVQAQDGSSDTFTSFGTVSQGHESTWQELELMASAELTAAKSSSEGGLDDTVTAALAKIKDPHHRRVIAQIDKTMQSRSLFERSRRNGSAKQSPKVRARGEPVFCDFVLKNPLGAPVHVTQLQLVASLVDSQEVACTNEDAIRMRSKGGESDKTWTFASTDNVEFSLPEFCRISEPGQKSCKSTKDNPFFVVTKQNVDMTPGGEIEVSAGLTPLVEGNLEILGVRCKLCDEVWVYHPFDIPGPLLDDTRANRANRVRGESVALKSKIEVEMPCLTADLIQRSPNDTPLVASDGGPLIQGQISTWTIRLRNVGNAPATHAALKTNLPWVNLSKTAAESESTPAKVFETQATSNCLGPSGTLMSLPIQGDHLVQQGVIRPGESVDIPIEIRTSHPGKQGFYMLYRYEQHDSSGPTTRHRWLRKMHEVSVYPSLSLNVKALSSYWKDNEELLSVELTNNRTDRPTDLYVTLDALRLVSRNYQLEALPGQFSTSDQVANVLQIGWQERVTVHYRLVPLDEGGRNCLLSECPFLENASSTTRECAVAQSTGFLCVERANETFEEAWKKHQLELARAEHASDGEGQHPRSIASIRRANTADSGDLLDDGTEIHPTSLAKVCPRLSSLSKVHIICNWRAILGQEVIRGEHHVRSVSVRPLKFFDGCPVSATANHPNSVSHNFSKGPAIVPMEVTLRNRMLETPVKFYVSVEEHPTFELIGLDMLLLSLDANDDVTIAFDALIPRAGIHDLQALQVTVRQEDKKEVTYQVQQQWLVHVTDEVQQ